MKGIALYDLDFFKRKKDNDLIKENITRILLTSKGERVNNPEFGSNLQRFLFSSYSSITYEEIEDDIRRSINRWEPRVSVQNINTISTKPDSINIFLSLFNRETTEEFTYEVVLNLWF